MYLRRANTEYFNLKKILAIIFLVINVTICNDQAIDDNGDFKKLVNRQHFVDKSEFIREFLQYENEVLLITRPTGFGKSINLDMLKTFLEIEVDDYGNPLPIKSNSKYFENLKILKSKQKNFNSTQYQGIYPVIYLSFKNVTGSTYKEIQRGIQLSVKKAFIQHRYLLRVKSLHEFDKEILEKYFTSAELDVDNIEYSLQFLSRYLSKHFKKKTFVFTDDFDTPIYKAYFHSTCTVSERYNIVNSITDILNVVYKDNEYLQQGLICGTTQMPKPNTLLRGFNNCRTFTVQDSKFSSSFGFTEKEISGLLEKLRKNDHKKNIKFWYGGYRFKNDKFLLYNPWSVMRYLHSRNNKLENYWVFPDDLAIVNKSLNTFSIELMTAVIELTKNFSLDAYINKEFVLSNPTVLISTTSFYTSAVHLGYLIFENTRKVRIPNAEVQNIFAKLLRNWICRRTGIQDDEIVQIGDRIFEALRGKNFAGLIKKLDAFFRRFFKYVNFNVFHMTKELWYSTDLQDFHTTEDIWYDGCMYLFLLSSKYRNDFEIFAERNIKKQNDFSTITADVLLVPYNGKGSEAYLLNYKVIKSAKNMFKSIIESIKNVFSSKKKKEIGQTNNNNEFDVLSRKFLYLKTVSNITIFFYNSSVEITHDTKRLPNNL